jgi:hypothetical protein
MRRTLITLTALALTQALAAQADAPNWVRVSTAEDHEFVDFIDLNSLAIRGGRLTARYLWNFNAVQTDTITHRRFQSETGVGTYDCLNRTTGSMEYTLYAKRGALGRVIHTGRVNPKDVNQTAVEPNSMGDDEMEFVCSTWGARSSAHMGQGWGAALLD